MAAEAQFVAGKVVGFLEEGIFTQRVGARHIFRRYNAKGMDPDLYKTLRMKRCHTWRLELDTGEVLTLPLNNVVRFGIEVNTHGAGKQIMVPLRYFTQEDERSACQGTLL